MNHIAGVVMGENGQRQENGEEEQGSDPTPSPLK